ncbi:reverse transcriptase domain-containing protein [Heyndrickxia oleronia]|uniref:reverse transcriptase domain-containing protein n=1 Tax=Heyndrickxia oleronia TaxID=38875 RepID=UPI00203EB0C2|nr:reverse transcriptase domain-containing protein [Heyndrickxia oleronia]MCM3239588.1 reverse transcriptase domain-containing protein [Heyndrickxia oleronia]
MIKNPFGIEELYIAWMRCRYFNYQEVRKFKINTEIEFYDEYIDEIILDLHNKLNNQQYRFSDKQIFLMPKNSGLLRRNSFISITDQIVSHAILNFIGKKIDSKFYYWSCANRIIKKNTNFSAQTFIPYLQQYNKFLNHTIYKINKGYQWVCETDIVSYFDHIDQKILLSKLRSQLKDEKYSYITHVLIPSFLESSYFHKGERNKHSKGIPQGGALSYFLSNVYLNELDHNMKNYTGIKYLRYVDDIRLLGETKQEVEEYLLQLQADLWELGLEINSGKSKIYKVKSQKDIEDFQKEQSEKLSLIDKCQDTKQNKLKKYKSILSNNQEELSSSEDEFLELYKLRNRKINFSISKLISNGDPNAFPYLKNQLENNPEKASYLLEKLYYYKFKEKKLDVLDLNQCFLNRPYETYIGATLSNLYSWGLLSYDKLNRFLPSETGIIELYILQNKYNSIDPLLIKFIINKIFKRLNKTNPYLINCLLFQLSNPKYFSKKFKMLFIRKIIDAQIYKTNNCCHFIGNLLIKDNSLWYDIKESGINNVSSFINYLKSENEEIYEMLLSKEERELYIEPDQGFISLEEIHPTLTSVNEIFYILKELINLINNNKYYFENPIFINAKNIWIKNSLYSDIQIKLNPTPIKDKKLYLSSPEDQLDRENIDNDTKISFIIGLLIFSLLLKDIAKINKLHLPYIQFNPVNTWRKNKDYFKIVFHRNSIDKNPSNQPFYEILSIIEKLTKKNPKSRLKISDFENYLKSKQAKGEKAMKFFISHSTRDKGRITQYTEIIQNTTNHEVLIDHEQFRYGQVISEEIKKKINESDMVIVFYSKNVAEKPKWIMDEVAYSIDIDKPFVCVLMDDIELPELLKTENEKLYFLHKDSTSLSEIEVFIHKLSGLEFEQIKTKVNIDKFNPSRVFIEYLRSKKDMDLSFLTEKKQYEILDALTKSPELKLIPVAVFNKFLGGADINASTYKDEILILKHFEILETIESGDKITSIKLLNNEFHKSIYEAKMKFSPYWKEYLINSIEIELYKNQKSEKL